MNIISTGKENAMKCVSSDPLISTSPSGGKGALLWTADWSLKTNVLYFVNVTTEGNRGEREPASLVSPEFTAS